MILLYSKQLIYSGTLFYFILNYILLYYFVYRYILINK